LKVHLIEAYISKYKVWLEEQEVFEETYKYECLKNFRQHWDLEAVDLADMFDNSFKSKISNRLWGGSVNSSKSRILDFIDINKEYVRSMFKDLFNEEKDVTMRINRFSFHCDQMMDELQHKQKKLVDHKQNAKVVSVYLTLNDPLMYTIFDYRNFKKMLENLDTQEIPGDFEMERFFKLGRGLYKILTKDEDLVALHASKIPEKYKSESNLLLVHDFYTISNRL
jgi:hypothetical protein